MRALKVVSPRLSAEPRFRERFRRESRLAASIERPNVIPVHQAGEEGGHLYLAMRLVEGSDLRHMVIVGGPLEATEAAGVIEAVPPASTRPTRPGSSTATSNRRTSSSAPGRTPAACT